MIKPRRAGDIAICYANPGKAKRELGWEAKYDLERMCKDSSEFYQEESRLGIGRFYGRFNNICNGNRSDYQRFCDGGF